MVQLHLPSYEGPLQLLLELIERRRLDISELSLAQVADQYLEQIAELSPRVEALAEFIEIGGRLVLLKARQIVPPPADETPTEADEAASELVEMVREYARYRDAVAALTERDRAQQRAYAPLSRPDTVRPQVLGLPDSVTLDLLSRIAQEAIAAAKDRERQRAQAADAAIEREPITVRDRVADLRRRLSAGKPVSFRRWIAEAASRRFVIVSFLALLELHKTRAIELRQDAAWHDIEVTAAASPPQGAWAVGGGALQEQTGGEQAGPQRRLREAV